MQNTMNDIMNYIPVTLDQAKLLKDLGYNKKTFWYWNDIKNIPYVTIGLKIGDKKYNHNSDKYNNISVYSAPRQDDPEVILLLTKYLREKTGSGIMNCKKALIQNDLDIEKSIKTIITTRNTL